MTTASDDQADKVGHTPPIDECVAKGHDECYDCGTCHTCNKEAEMRLDAAEARCAELEREVSLVAQQVIDWSKHAARYKEALLEIAYRGYYSNAACIARAALAGGGE